MLPGVAESEVAESVEVVDDFERVMRGGEVRLEVEGMTG